jgi:hypothetical protein
MRALRFSVSRTNERTIRPNFRPWVSRCGHHECAARDLLPRKEAIMDVQQEISSARKQRSLGLLIIILSFPFIIASMVLALYDYSQYYGVGPISRITTAIYQHTQIPLLSTVWAIAARPSLIDIMEFHNLWFAGEVVILFLGMGMVGAAGVTLHDIAKAKHEATQKMRQDQFHRKQ